MVMLPSIFKTKFRFMYYRGKTEKRTLYQAERMASGGRHSSGLWLLAMLLLAIATIIPASVAAATLTASVDRTELARNEYLQLTLSLINSDTRLRAEGVAPNVDLTLLTPDFDLGTPQTSHRFNINRDRGRATSELVVQLFPKRTGLLTIPAFDIDGSKSPPIKITVYPAADDKSAEVFSRIGVTKTEVWQKEQVIAYIDLFSRVEIASAELGGDIEAEPTPLELLNAIQLPISTRREKIDDFTYTVTRRAWALFVPGAGELTLHAPALWIVTKAGKKLRLPTQQQRLLVKTLPDNVTPDMIVGEVKLSQAPITEQFRVGELLPWNVTLTTNGLLHDIPQQLALPTLPALKIYTARVEPERKITEQGIVYSVSYPLMVTPLKSGTITMPPVALPYFGPARGTVLSSSLAPQTITAEPTGATTNTAGTMPATVATANNFQKSFFWPAMAAIMTLLWLATLYWYRRKPRLSIGFATITAPSAVLNDHRDNSLKSKLLHALQARTLDEGLTAWEKLYGADQEVALAILTVQRSCYGNEKVLPENKISEIVENALKKISIAEPIKKTAISIDPWLPQAFTAQTQFSVPAKKH